ncbi:MAG: formate dehydrogenase accessory sulfurtransferase FdhD [Acidimicrobiia bacterium]
MTTSTPRTIHKLRHGKRATATDHLVTEAPVELRLDGTPLAVLMRTPGNDAELALGFVLTEGVVLYPEEVAEVRRVPEDPEDNRWEITLSEGTEFDPEQLRRNFYATSSCGVCGKASIDAVRVAARQPPPGPILDPETLLAMPSAMRQAQETFARTGGLHAAAAFEPDGTLVVLREDVGRHNAVDKLIGALAPQRWPIGELVLAVSGRVSFEIVQKAAVAGIPVVCGVSAASSLAVELAEELGLTVVGFLREGGFNIYAGERRIRTS